jgi:pimeloyl-ACP methyl ester carboxylesterase
MKVQHLTRENPPKLAYIHTPASGDGIKYPPVIFLGGYRSDMTGTKALYLEEMCRARGQEFVRFDYSGHGQSEGEFENGTIGVWKNDALAIIDKFAHKPVILVGSSMGGWMALLAAIARPGLVCGLVGIAAAPDFTEDIYSRLSLSQQAELHQKGRVSVPNDYSNEPYNFNMAFYVEAKNHMILSKKRTFAFPVRLVQGKEDKDVPWQTAEKIKEAIGSPDFKIIYIEDGGHRLSRPEDMEIIGNAAKELST